MPRSRTWGVGSWSLPLVVLGTVVGLMSVDGIPVAERLGGGGWATGVIAVVGVLTGTVGWGLGRRFRDAHRGAIWGYRAGFVALGALALALGLHLVG